MTTSLSAAAAQLRHQERVAEYRRASTALRHLQRSGGFTAATTNAISRHERIRAAAVTALQGHKQLLGLLAEEDSLAKNIDQRKANNAGHAELDARLRVARRAIRDLTAN